MGVSESGQAVYAPSTVFVVRIHVGEPTHFLLFSPDSLTPASKAIVNKNRAARPSTFQPRAIPPRWGGTPRDIAEEWLSGYYSYSPRTRALYRDAILVKFIGWLEEHGVEEMADVRPGHINAFMQAEFERPRLKERSDGDRPGKISTSSLMRLHQNLRSFFRWCVASEYMVSSPMDSPAVKAPKQIASLRTAFTREEAQRLVRWNSFKGIRALRYRDRAIVLLLLDCALRASELLSLEVDSIETRTRAGNARLLGAEAGKQTEHWLKVRGKGQKERFVRVGDSTYKAVIAWLRVRFPSSGSSALFTTIQGNPMTYQALHKMVHNLGVYAGVEDCYIHRFRHTGLTELYLDSTNIELVKMVAGHSDVVTTGRYLRRVGIQYQQSEYRTPGEWLA